MWYLHLVELETTWLYHITSGTYQAGDKVAHTKLETRWHIPSWLFCVCSTSFCRQVLCRDSLSITSCSFTCTAVLACCWISWRLQYTPTTTTHSYTSLTHTTHSYTSLTHTTHSYTSLTHTMLVVLHSSTDGSSVWVVYCPPCIVHSVYVCMCVCVCVCIRHINNITLDCLCH